MKWARQKRKDIRKNTKVLLDPDDEPYKWVALIFKESTMIFRIMALCSKWDTVGYQNPESALKKILLFDDETAVIINMNNPMFKIFYKRLYDMAME